MYYSTLDDLHLREGVCLRIEASDRTYILKHKSPNFLMAEDNLKSQDDYVDIEEVQSLDEGDV